MPSTLYFGIVLCECGQIFKTENHSRNHALTHNHSLTKYTLSIDKNLKPTLRKGAAITSYDNISSDNSIRWNQKIKKSTNEVEL